MTEQDVEPLATPTSMQTNVRDEFVLAGCWSMPCTCATFDFLLRAYDFMCASYQ